MKQAIALLLAVYMLLAVLAGCTAKTTTDAEPAPSTTEQETSSETQTPAEAEQAGPVELGLMLWEASEAETEPLTEASRTMKRPLATRSRRALLHGANIMASSEL